MWKSVRRAEIESDALVSQFHTIISPWQCCYERVASGGSCRDPDEECITVVFPGRGTDEFFYGREGEGGMQFRNVMEVKEGSFADGIDMIVKGKVRFQSYPLICNRRGVGNGVSRE